MTASWSDSHVARVQVGAVHELLSKDLLYSLLNRIKVPSGSVLQHLEGRKTGCTFNKTSLGSTLLL